MKGETYSADCIAQLDKQDTMQEAKPFQIDKRIIFEAFKKVKFN